MVKFIHPLLLYKFVVFLFATFTAAAVQNVPFIEWKKNRKLTWRDYRAAADTTVRYHAQTFVREEWSYHWMRKDGKYTFWFTTKSVMNPNLSWVKKEHRSDYLLEHEQAHFDISALHSRALLYAFNHARLTENYKQELQRIKDANLKSRDDMQKQFDEQTNHSQNRDMEVRWVNHINALLNTDAQTIVALPK